MLAGFISVATAVLVSPQDAALRSYDPVAFSLLKPEGLRFVINNGRTPRKHQPETMVAGVAFFDYDNDGRLDIYAVNGASMPGLEKKDESFFNRLFRNVGDGSFEDATSKAGVPGRGYNLGVATGDYDNDGDTDLFVAGLRENILYRNNGDGTFTDATVPAGLGNRDPEYGTLWAVAAAWLDYDRDGWLDLFVSNYCVWDPDIEPICPVNNLPDYCHPKLYKGLPNSLFRNNGNGTFTDVSASSGIRRSIGKGMGLGVADFDGDGWTDVFVANDTLPSSLFHNQRNGTFREIAVESFVAYTDRGKAVSGMGADARDINNDGRPDIFETAMVNETFPYYHNVGGMFFEERTYLSGMASLSIRKSGWSNGVFDFNNDGWKDFFVACGDVMDTDGYFGSRVPQSNAVYVNLKNGRFADAGVGAGEDFQKKAVHRGVAFGDIDNDGRMDAVVTALNGPIELWRNISETGNHWLLVKATGTKSNRDGAGAKIKVVTASSIQYNHVNTAVGYACASDVRVHFGLGKESVVRELEILWPSGTVQTLKNVRADQILEIVEEQTTG
ncbi:MAG: CRTAC1 family protein [Acidobacteria bacterium]|nr:CRTAC1 family protein [Acidobacteriota bacterium]